MVVHSKKTAGRNGKKAARRKRMLQAAALGAMGLSIQGGGAKASTFSFTSSVQSYTIPTTGTYEIVGFGAQGGFSGSNVAGGLGAKIGGFFSLTAGTELQIVVGGQGGTGGPAFGGYGGGGGGASFVYNATTSALLLAAGGGGGGYTGNVGGNGQIGLGSNPGAAGTGSDRIGGGGAGFSANASGQWGGLGSPFFFGGVTAWGGGANGGFGGGGASGGYGAGGGGGFGGGNAGIPSGGGYSFNGGTSQTNIAGFRVGNGEVSLDLVPVPEPTTTALMATGFAALAGLSAARSRRRSVHVPL